jgi:hypothetical protein
MPTETVGDRVEIVEADHPPRSQSRQYAATRRELMEKYGGGCFICDGVVDLSHPGVGDSKGLQDHHGGGLYALIGDRPVLVALGLLELEWSEGWGSDPKVVAGMVANANLVRKRLGTGTYDQPIEDADGIMRYADSIFNANVKLCTVHHIGHPNKDALDSRGQQGVGIHYIPLPIVLYQLTCDWQHWDMFAGTTGTIAVAPHPTRPGAAQVLHVDAAHPDGRLVSAAAEGKQVTLPPGNSTADRAHRTEKYRTPRASQGRARVATGQGR